MTAHRKKTHPEIGKVKNFFLYSIESVHIIRKKNALEEKGGKRQILYFFQVVTNHHILNHNLISSQIFTKEKLFYVSEPQRILKGKRGEINLQITSK